MVVCVCVYVCPSLAVRSGKDKYAQLRRPVAGGGDHERECEPHFPGHAGDDWGEQGANTQTKIRGEANFDQNSCCCGGGSSSNSSSSSSTNSSSSEPH